MKTFIIPILILFAVSSCSQPNIVSLESERSLERAIAILDSLYKHYDAGENNLLKLYAHKGGYTPDMEIANDIQTRKYSELWPYSETLTAITALLVSTGDRQYMDLLNNKVIPGLENYFDDKRLPAGYASYVNTAPESNRYYEDNVWIGIDFADIYLKTRDSLYLKKADLAWRFVISGMDEKLQGGIYKRENDSITKTTCASAAGSVLSLKLYESTKDSIYLEYGLMLHDWTRRKLRDRNDYLYYDNISVDGLLAKAKYGYNNGLMIQASVLMYKHTGNDKYLVDAQRLAAATYEYFFNDFVTEDGEKIKVFRMGNMWSMAVMMRGYIELYQLDGNRLYLETFKNNLDYCWKYMRDDNDGLFVTEWNGGNRRDNKWLLTDASIMEMYGRMAGIR